MLVIDSENRVEFENEIESSEFSSSGVGDGFCCKMVATAIVTLLVIWLMLPSSVLGQAPEGFTAASPERVLTFPRDHGAHPDFQTEWWYITGVLQKGSSFNWKAEPDYGFQLTFFRRATRSPGGVKQLYLAHAALSDIRAKHHTASSRRAPGDFNLATASERLLAVRNHEWRLEQVGDEILALFSVGDAQVSLRFADPGIRLLQGQGGFSQKGSSIDSASHYYSMPRLSARGRISTASTDTELVGRAWYDHEFMSNALESGQTGWDWFSLMLEDGRDIMLFRLRHNDPARNRYAITVARDGVVLSKPEDTFTLRELRTWKSPETNASYPVAWAITIPAHDLSLTLEPLLDNQELDLGADTPRYWEGAVSIQGTSRGFGYLEMTGYAGSMDGVL